ncbi:MAG: 2-oxo acid dehydrogenase subunit E2 [Chitinophagaceae bacterium]|nr:MAG: 2-oxo acid dehydrogenase subunit E2 [Chitinophagaceae bacterium]
MAKTDLIMPKLGESIMEATILKWHKNPGDMVKMDETILEIATDKVDSEVPSTAEGILEEILFKVNDVVPIGSVIARINTSAAEPAGNTPAGQPAAPAAETTAPNAAQQQPQQQPQAPAKSPSYQAVPRPSNGQGPRFYSPLVLNIAASEGVSVAELEQLDGSGSEGRVTKKDILQYLGDRKNGNGSHSRPQDEHDQYIPATVTTHAPQVQAQPPQQSQQQFGGNVEIIEMDRMRKLIADHMVRSKHTSPHVTSFTEADVTNLVLWRDKVKKDFEKREATKITFTPIFIEAVARCIKKFPMINSSLDGDRIIIKKDINIGMATALPTGNLIVPVIKNADQLNLVGLSKKVNSLADAARTSKLKADDTQGGTFTLTNVGTFGSLMGTPIINQPQVAILAVGAIKKRPVVIETEQGDSIAIRHMMYLSMSYDHRIVDGSLGATFLTAVAKELENFDSNREI